MCILKKTIYISNVYHTFLHIMSETLCKPYEVLNDEDWQATPNWKINNIYEEKSIPMIVCDVQHLVITADFLMPEPQQPIVAFMYSSYFLKDIVKL